VNDVSTIQSVSSGSVTLAQSLTHTYVSGTAVTVPAANLALTSTNGITPGTQLTIGTGATQETDTVSYVSGGTVTLVNALNYSHSSGETVTFTGGIGLVTWRVSGGNLQRAVISGSASCSPGAFASGYASPTWVTIASGIDCLNTTTSGENCVTTTPTDPVYFTALLGGTAQSGGTIASPLNCTGAGASSCYFDNVGLSATLSEAGGTLRYAQNFPVNTNGSRLGV
jgi:hypothetical protein